MTGERQARVTNSGCAVADDFLNKSDQESNVFIERLSKLIQGYESPYGLELLSSVHWLAHHEGHHPVEKIIAEMLSWSERKRNSFSEAAIRVAYDRLQEDKLLN
jgi:hypothetical protein